MKRELWVFLVGGLALLIFALGRPSVTAATPLVAPLDDTACQWATGRTAPAFTYDYQLDLDSTGEPLVPQIANYLNVAGCPDGLASALEAAQANSIPITAQVVNADFNNDGQPDILVLFTLSYGAGFTENLSLYTRTDQGYITLGSLHEGNWGDSSIKIPASIVAVVDLNNNQRRDIVVHKMTVNGMKFADVLSIYEWDGHSLVNTFELSPGYGGFSDITVRVAESDPTSLEMDIGYFYAYEEETANSVVEYSLVRPINMIYRWDGTDYNLICQYFTDTPTTRLTILHSAETLRSCGFYDRAVPFYQQLFDDDRIIQPWEYEPWLTYPESLTADDHLKYFSQLERAYLRAFAGYRLIQIALTEQDMNQAQSVLDDLQQDYSRGDNGYIYVAMAASLMNDYATSADLAHACHAAERTFNEHTSQDDPGIAYYEDAGSGYHYGFYFANMRHYGADPDNVFAVPSEIDSIISTPVCLS